MGCICNYPTKQMIKMRSKSYLYAVVFLSGLLCVVLKASAQNVQIYSQECPTFFEGDSLYLRYGTKYAIKDIPEAYFLFVEHALGRQVSRDSILEDMSENGQKDSVRLMAPRNMIRINKVDYVIVKKEAPELQGFVNDGGTCPYVENGAWLFDLSYKARFSTRMRPILCNLLVINIKNYDPSFTHLEFRNVTARISPHYPPGLKSRANRNRMTLSRITQIDDAATLKSKPSEVMDLDIIGEIHGERILPDGTFIVGKLYDFRIHTRRDDSRDLNYIRPYLPFKEE